MERIMARNTILKIAQLMEDAITSMMNPISSGSLTGVLNRTMERAPSKPSESGNENWIQIKIAVMEMLRSGKLLWILLPVRLAFEKRA
jgi:hypothetical protein